MKKIYYSMITLALLGMMTGCDTDNTVSSHTNSAPAASTSADRPDATASKSAAPASEDEKLYEKEVAEAEQQNADASDSIDGTSIDGGDRNGGGDVVITPKAGWYMRTVVTAILPDGTEYRHDSAGVFGELDESVDRRDRHDIESYGKAILQTVFVNNRVDIAKTYFSDYRTYHEGSSPKEVWTFLVKNETGVDLSQADLKIEVGKVYDVFKKEGESRYREGVSADQSKRDNLILVDVDNRKTYSYDELQNTVLNMDGKHVRTFRWVLNGSVSSEDMKPRKVIDVMTTGGSSVFTPRNMAVTGSSKFGLPPE